ncbi:class I SAM-dependent methyltransferase [Ruminococcaceae bacterium OttesenSCG-928-O06]|nr:class I SAM-dependent methyltransferase [Ruminococcaceae bacterium OttesenSCG-928-O06]
MNTFDEMAARYETPQRVQVANIIADAMRPHLAGCAGKNGIDYGCGTGLVGLQLAECFGSMLFVDASPPMVELVKDKIRRMGVHNADALCADFTEEAPAGLSADCILMVQVLLHIPDTERILRQMYGVMNPGGHILIVDFDKNEAARHERVHNGFVQADLMELMEGIGYTGAASKTFHQAEQYFMNQDATLFLLDATKPGEM